MQYLTMRVRSSWLPTSSILPSQIRWEWLMMQGLVIFTTLAYFTFIYIPILPIWKTILQVGVSSTLLLVVSLAILAHAQGIKGWFQIPLILWSISTTILVGLTTQSLDLPLPVVNPFWTLAPSGVLLPATLILNQRFHFIPEIPWGRWFTRLNFRYTLAGIALGILLAAHLRFATSFIPGLGRVVQFPFSISDAFTVILIGVAALGEELFFRQIVFTFLLEKKQLTFHRLLIQMTAMIFLLSMAEALQTSMVITGLFVVTYHIVLSLLNTLLRYHLKNLSICIAANLIFSILFWIIRG